MELQVKNNIAFPIKTVCTEAWPRPNCKVVSEQEYADYCKWEDANSFFTDAKPGKYLLSDFGKPRKEYYHYGIANNYWSESNVGYQGKGERTFRPYIGTPKEQPTQPATSKVEGYSVEQAIISASKAEYPDPTDFISHDTMYDSDLVYTKQEAFQKGAQWQSQQHSVKEQELREAIDELQLKNHKIDKHRLELREALEVILLDYVKLKFVGDISWSSEYQQAINALSPTPTKEQ